MDELIEAKLVLEAVHALGIDVPVMSTRMVGDRLELYLYGGPVRVYRPSEKADAPGNTRASPPSPSGRGAGGEGESPDKAISSISKYLHPPIRDLESMSLVALRDLARRWKVPGWNRLNKAKLIEALRNARA